MSTHSEIIAPPGNDPAPIGEDLLIGVDEIAGELKRPERAVRYLIERRVIPTFKVGSQHAAFRSAIRAHLHRLAEGAAAA
jgi:hypothetical protein